MRVVDIDVALGRGLGDLGWDSGTREGADFLVVGVIVQDVAVGACGCAHEGDAANEWVCGEAGDDGLLDVDSVLGENDHSFAGCYGGRDNVSHRWGDVRDVLCRYEDEIKWWEILLYDIWDGFADFNDTLESQYVNVLAIEENSLLVGLNLMPLPYCTESMFTPFAFTAS